MWMWNAMGVIAGLIFHNHMVIHQACAANDDNRSTHTNALIEIYSERERGTTVLNQRQESCCKDTNMSRHTVAQHTHEHSWGCSIRPTRVMKNTETQRDVLAGKHTAHVLTRIQTHINTNCKWTKGLLTDFSSNWYPCLAAIFIWLKPQARNDLSCTAEAYAHTHTHTHKPFSYKHHLTHLSHSHKHTCTHTSEHEIKSHFRLWKAKPNTPKILSLSSALLNLQHWKEL